MQKLSLFLIVLLFYSCQKTAEEQYFEAIENNDVALLPPTPNDWLYSHKEKGQSFDAFLKSKHVVSNKDSNVIYLKPIGNFTALQAKQIELTREYLEIYFHLKTKVLQSSSNDIIPKHARRIGYDGQEQFLAGYILDSI